MMRPFRTTFQFVNGDLSRRDFSRFEVPDRSPVPFDTIELLRRLDAE